MKEDGFGSGLLQKEPQIRVDLSPKMWKDEAVSVDQ